MRMIGRTIGPPELLATNPIHIMGTVVLRELLSPWASPEYTRRHLLARLRLSLICGCIGLFILVVQRHKCRLALKLFYELIHLLNGDFADVVFVKYLEDLLILLPIKIEFLVVLDILIE